MDGKLRFCVDCCKLNAVRKRDSYPINCRDECIFYLDEAAIFSTSNASSGYWDVEIGEADQDETACTSHHQLGRFICITLGLQNASKTSQSTMEAIFSTIKWRLARFYLNNITIFSRSPPEHKFHVRNILTFLRNAGVTFEFRNVDFFTKTIDYLGYVSRPRRIEIASPAKNVISGLQAPTNLKNLLFFLVLFNVFRQFFPNIARIAAPLKVKLRKDQPTTFGPLNNKEL